MAQPIPSAQWPGRSFATQLLGRWFRAGPAAPQQGHLSTSSLDFCGLPLLCFYASEEVWTGQATLCLGLCGCRSSIFPFQAPFHTSSSNCSCPTVGIPPLKEEMRSLLWFPISGSPSSPFCCLSRFWPHSLTGLSTVLGWPAPRPAHLGGS